LQKQLIWQSAAFLKND